MCQFEHWFLPGVLYNGNFDPEGFLSILPAMATAIAGMMNGRYLKRNTTHLHNRKVTVYFVAGIY